ncbi:hypothetical protein [Asticcacaulis sp. AND118]|uniref:hypothetical protein n=1 Tax=Asticcacaulis sp. AND118 TaxID=2840468 RepID=UPI001CFFC5F6|nr:hypothetical protein [Asticcacaulis sp. AND118]UDF04019.1 hypothetical protein LH365_02955 [Asticcacaulis sp. AND118]
MKTLPIALFTGFLWTAAAVAQTPAPATPPGDVAKPAQTGPAQTSPGQSNPEWLEKNNSFTGAATAPLDDLNLRKLEIPAILVTATEKPYDIAGLTTCPALSAEIGRLDEVLGPDLDALIAEDTRSLTQKGEAMANRGAVSAVRDASTGIIPFRGVVRKLTGAEKHQKAIEAALEAGQSRRAYLKGIGIARNCAPPAAPAWFVPQKAAAVKAKPKAKTPVKTTKTKPKG